MNNSLGTGCDISCRKHARFRRHSILVYNQKSAFRAFESYCSTDQLSSRSLTDGDDRGVCLYLFLLFLIADNFTVLIKNGSTENRTLLCDILDFFTKNEFCSIKFCIGDLMGACRCPGSSCIQCYMARTVSKCCSCHIHRCISHTDDRNIFTKLIARWICQIVDTELYVSETFSVDA